MNDALRDDLSLQRQPFVLVSRVPAHLEKIGERNTTAVAFNDVEAAASWVGRAEAACRNFYVVRNHVRDGALYRRNRDGERIGPSNWGNPPLLEDIEAIEWFAIDIDPVDTRHEVARDHAVSALHRMPVPLYYITDSRPGVQAAVRLAVPVTQTEPDRYRSAIALAMRVQTWLKQFVDKTLVQVDNVANANRFSRLCGTINQKTGRRSEWIVPPDAKEIVRTVDGVLASVEIPPVRQAGLVALPDGLSPFVAEAVRETGLKPSPRHIELLRGIV